MAGCCSSSEVPNPSQDEEKGIQLLEQTYRPADRQVALAGGQAELYSLPEDFHVASFRPEEVAKILKRRKEEKKKSKAGRLKDLFTASGVEYRIIKFPILFLVFFYVIQIDFQLDSQYSLMCPDQWINPAGHTVEAARAQANVCRKGIKEKFKIWQTKTKAITSLLTFLLGFYVADIMRRWWVKVVGVPNVRTPQLILGGLVRATPGPSDGSLISPEAVTEAQRMVARYCLLAWTLCLSSFSKPLAETVGTPAKLVKKGLLTEQERKALKADSSDPEVQKLVTDRWWVPLGWAVTLVGRLGPTAPADQHIFTKDYKDAVTSLSRLEAALDNQKERCDTKLPAFYQRVIHWAVYAWVAFGVFTFQDPTHHTDRCTVAELDAGSDTCGAPIWLTLILNFPTTGMLLQLVILSWLAMADILQNPFGFNPDYDINLTEELEVNIWRASETLQQLGSRGAGGAAGALQAKLWAVIAPGGRGA